MKFMKRAFLPPRTLMTGILGGGRSIQLSYSDSYKIYIYFTRYLNLLNHPKDLKTSLLSNKSIKTRNKTIA